MELWIVGKCTATVKTHTKDEDTDTATWEFAGVYDSEEKAIAACVDRRYFIGPAALNSTLPDEKVEWPDSYYPLTEKPEQQTV